MKEALTPNPGPLLREEWVKALHPPAELIMRLGLARPKTDDDRELELVVALSFRRGFVGLCALFAVACVGQLIYFLASTTSDLWTQHAGAMTIRTVAISLAAVLSGALIPLRNRFHSTRQLHSITNLLIIVIGGLLVGSRLVLQTTITNYGVWGLVDIGLLHIAACLALPWKPWNSIEPFILLMLAWVVIVVGPWTEFVDQMSKAVLVILGATVFAPGAAIAWWRNKRLHEEFTRRMLGEKVQSMGGELSRARIVHDAMFPRAFDFEHVAFQYEYAPIQEIGGDYVHLYHCPRTGRIYLTLLDVAGHGLAAALTVNRLFGELERIRAENPDAEPAEVMGLLNKYIHLTMSKHSLFATGTCLMLDPSNGQLKWVNAGHPPAFIRRASGAIEDLEGTAMLLGVESYDEFDAGQLNLSMRPGDVLIAYTDGAVEARDKHGHQFGIKGLRDNTRFNPPPRNWARFLATAVARHHDGQSDDDILIVSLSLRGLHMNAAANKPVATETVQSAP